MNLLLFLNEGSSSFYFFVLQFVSDILFSLWLPLSRHKEVPSESIQKGYYKKVITRRPTSIRAVGQSVMLGDYRNFWAGAANEKIAESHGIPAHAVDVNWINQHEPTSTLTVWYLRSVFKCKKHSTTVVAKFLQANNLNLSPIIEKIPTSEARTPATTIVPNE